MVQKNLIAKILQSTAVQLATLLVGVVAAAWVLIASKSVRRQIDKHGVLILIVAIVIIIVLVVYVDVLVTKRSEAEEEAKKLATDLGAARAKLADPTKRDPELFQSFVDALPGNGGVCAYLRNTFEGESWREDNINPLKRYLKDNEKGSGAYFEDSAVEAQRKTLRDAVKKFLDGLSECGIPNGGLHYKTFKIKPDAEFEVTRTKLKTLAEAVLSARDGLYRTGRGRGL